MKIERTELIRRLKEFALTGSGLVIGNPGAGKTFALWDLRSSLIDDGTLTRVFTIDQVFYEDRKDILSRLHLKDKWTDELKKQSDKVGCEKSVLIFDSFDSARNEAKRKVWLGLIEEALRTLPDTWHVLVSARTYDAEKSYHLRELFSWEKGIPGRTCRAFTVGEYTEEELTKAFQEKPELKKAFEASTSELKTILRNPFNLWLLENLSDGKQGGYQHTEYRSASQLLGLFWKIRLEQAPSQQKAEIILKDLTEKQVESARLVSFKDELYSYAEDDIGYLFSSAILKEDQETKKGIRFSHNIIFDYAVSALLLSDEALELQLYLAQQPARQLFLRPSLVYHFEGQFFDPLRNKKYWNNFISSCEISNPSLSPLNRIILPSILVKGATQAEDYGPLLSLLSQGRQEAILAFTYYLQAIRALEPPTDTIGSKTSIWIEVFAQASNYLSKEFTWELGFLTDKICQIALKDDHQDILIQCGKVGRNMLAWTWKERDKYPKAWNDPAASIWAIPLVIKTYKTDPEASRRLLSKALELLDDPGFPIEPIYRLCDNIEPLFDADPDLAINVYSRVFGHQETSEDKTHMGGYVIPLISNRRQDYGMCHFNLTQAYPKFIEKNPLKALKAAFIVVKTWVWAEHIYPYLDEDVDPKTLPVSFNFLGNKATYIEDDSYIWDDGPHADDEMDLIHRVDSYLNNLAKQGDKKGLLETLKVYAQNATVAVLWKHLIEIATDHPDFFAQDLLDLYIARPILTGSDTTYQIGELIKNSYKLFNPQQQKQIEDAILAIPEGDAGQSQRLHDHESLRNKLLNCIPAEYLQSAVARSILEEIKKEDKTYINRPLAERGQVETREFTTKDWLKGEGIVVDSETNKPLFDAVDDLEQMRRQHPTHSRTKNATELLLNKAELIYSMVKSESKADAKVISNAWSDITMMCEDVVSQWEALTTDHQEFVRKVLLEAAERPEPVYDDKYYKDWSASYFSGAPRNTAAQGLPWLIMWRPNDTEAEKAIRKLAKDSVPTVRYLLARDIFRISKNNAKLMGDILNDFVKSEENRKVLDGASLSIYNTLHIPESRQLVKDLYEERVLKDKEVYAYHKDVIFMIVDLQITQIVDWTEAIMESWRANPLDHADRIEKAAFRLTEYIKPKYLTDPASQMKFHISLKEQGQLLKACLEKLSWLNKQRNKEENTEELKKSWQGLYQAVDETITWYYFSFDFNHRKDDREEEPITSDERRAFWGEILPHLEMVAEYAATPEGGLMAGTAHHFMELLHGSIDFNPRKVLSLARKVAEGGTKGNYNLDSLGVGEVVKIAERILADYRHEVQDNEAMGDLLGLLDIFAQVGWPEALNIVWKLDEVYR